jgi:CelD/BcsL family acetyltransferase involved in cellulose biosynthesis
LVLLRIFQNREFYDWQESLRLVLHREIPNDANLRRQWNSLVLRMERPEVFFTYEWALAVSRAYQGALVPLLVLAYDRDCLVGVVALATDETRQETFFLGSATADYCDFVSSPAHRCEFVDLAFSELGRLEMPGLTLASLPEDSDTSRAITPAAATHGYKTFFRPASVCAQIALGSRMERQTLKSQVTTRKALRYALKGLWKRGPVSVDHLKSRESIRMGLPEFIQAHIARFLSSGRRSNLAQPQRQIFLTELADLLSTKGWIVLTRLRVGDHTVAWNYGFQFCGSWFYYQPTFDSDWRQFSPGFCLLSKIVEAGCDDPGIDRVDLGLGGEGYKQRFSTGARQTLDFTVTAATTRYLKAAARYHVAAAIKSSPRLEHGVRWALGRVPAGGGQG